MNYFRGDALSWESKEGIIELGLHRPPANEIGLAMLAELEHFVSTLESASEDASAIIIYSWLKAGFQRRRRPA